MRGNGKGNVNFEYKGMVMKARAYRHRENRWLVSLHWLGKRYKRFHYDDRTPLETEALANRIAERINGDIEDKGKNFDPRVWFRTPGNEFAFASYSENWLDRQKHLAPSYLKDVRRFVRMYWVPFFQQKDIREIRSGEIEDFIHWLPERLAAKSKHNILSALHKLFTDAVRREDILRKPEFLTIDVQEPEIKWLSKQWQDRIIQAILERDRPIFKFMRYYGVRPGEARALMWDCVDFENKLIIIRRSYSGHVFREITKNKRIKYLPLTAEMEALLKPIRGLGGFVFRNEWGRPYSMSISKIWNEARDAVGAPKVTLYQGTRHSCGTQKLMEGWTLEQVQQLFGHSRIEMTQRYAKVAMQTLRKLLEGEQEHLAMMEDLE